MPSQTPAEKSAEQTHLLAVQGTTLCGIKYKRRKFFDRNVVGEAKLSSCKKCTDKSGEVVEEKKPS